MGMNSYPNVTTTPAPARDLLIELADRIRMEYLEMPDLALTGAQVRRLWSLDADLCGALLDQLVTERFLARSSTGAYVRRRSQ